LTDSLVAKAGIIAAESAGDMRATDTRKDEQERGITIKSTGISMYFETDVMTEAEKLGYLINLIDSPGHVDFSSEVTAALRVTDGALVVVDYVEGVSVQTDTVLRQALGERIMPVLMVNKIDRGILELQVDGETMYQNFLRVIENVNVVIATYETEGGDQLQVDPCKGTVAFGSALFGWAFTTTAFAKTYSKKFGIARDKMMEKLWGDNYFDTKAKKWKNHSEADDKSTLKRCFVQFIMAPVIKLCKAAMNNEVEAVTKMTAGLNIAMKADELKLQGKHLMKNVF
jgi:elongation factor 2